MKAEEGIERCKGKRSKILMSKKKKVDESKNEEIGHGSQDIQGTENRV